MAFAAGEITLNDICNAYNVSKNMNALRGKTYYSASGVSSTVPSTGSINMGLFRGKYYGRTTGSIADQQANGNASGYWDGPVSGRVGFNSTSFTIIGNTLTSFSIEFYVGGGAGGATWHTGNNSTSISVTFDNDIYAVGTGNQSFTGLSATSTLIIQTYTQSTNNLGCQCSAGATYRYTISNSGLTIQ